MEKPNKGRRYRISDEMRKRFGLPEKQTNQYILNAAQELEMLTGRRIPKILIYDLETSRALFKAWWTGKTYLGTDKLVREPQIISVAWKWLGEDEVHALDWGVSKKNDEALVRKFAEVFNQADLVIGQNNDKFDNRWLFGRAMKYNIDIDTSMRSFDIMKQCKKYFRIPGYSMGFMTKFMGVQTKLEHDGIRMWDAIEDGPLNEAREYLFKMLEYNRQDIVATEEMYFRLQKYLGHSIHLGVLAGGSKADCPRCGSKHVHKFKTTFTPAGTIQHKMKCEKCESQYKISNRTFLDFVT